MKTLFAWNKSYIVLFLYGININERRNITMFTILTAIDGYVILLPLALILILSKLLSIGCKKIGFPQVVGMLFAGILIGLIKFIPNQTLLTEQAIDGIKFIAEIGVILIMFSAGLETDVKQIKQTGVSAIVITLLGVIVPMMLGFLVAGMFFGFTKENLWSNLFYGVILTATSVSVTVATMKELGKLNSKIGTAIVSAAILDDIIGVVVLSVVLSLSVAGGSSEIWIVILKTIGFFALVLIIGFFARKLFKWLEKKYPHNRRVSIFSLAFCFLLAYVSEKVFGIADITGAYAAGLILAGMRSSEYVERRTDIASYIIFTPVFFAKIGITINFDSLNMQMVGFGLCFVVAGILGKFIGCGFGARITKFSMKDAFRCGVGMMCRAEVCLICADKGIKAGIIDESIQPFILILIVITSFVTPLLLKISYNKETESNEEVTNTLVQNANQVQQAAQTISEEK